MNIYRYFLDILKNINLTPDKIIINNPNNFQDLSKPRKLVKLSNYITINDDFPATNN